MARNELQLDGSDGKNVAKASKFRSIQEIMKNPTWKAQLSNYVDEAVKCKTAIAVQQQNIKVLRDEALQGVGLKPSLFNAFVAASFNNDYAQRKEGLDELVSLLDLIMNDSQIGYDE